MRWRKLIKTDVYFYNAILTLSNEEWNEIYILNLKSYINYRKYKNYKTRKKKKEIAKYSLVLF